MGVVLAPLTVDVAVLDLLLDAIEPGSLPVPGIASRARARDGARALPAGRARSTARSSCSPTARIHGERSTRRSRRLREAGAVVHAIGVGTERGAPIPLAGEPGAFKRDRRRRGGGDRARARRLCAGWRRRPAATTTSRRDADLRPGTGRARRSRRCPAGCTTPTTISTLEERFQWPLALAVRGARSLAGARPRRAAAARGGGVRRFAGWCCGALIALAAQAQEPSAAAPEAVGSTASRLERWRWNPRERTARGIARQEAGDAAGAAAALDVAHRLAPESPTSAFNAGTARLGAGRPDALPAARAGGARAPIRRSLPTPGTTSATPASPAATRAGQSRPTSRRCAARPSAPTPSTTSSSRCASSSDSNSSSGSRRRNSGSPIRSRNRRSRASRTDRKARSRRRASRRTERAPSPSRSPSRDPGRRKRATNRTRSPRVARGASGPSPRRREAGPRTTRIGRVACPGSATCRR